MFKSLPKQTGRRGGCVAIAILALVVPVELAHAAKPQWDQIANVKAAATQIGGIQKSRGADAAVKFISACYKTHGVASAYSKFFEGCIAQDYMQSRALALIYQRLPAEHLKSIGAPSADQIVQSLRQRLGAAFSQYKIASDEGEAFLRLVEQHGFPQFMADVFKQPSPQPDPSIQPPKNRP